MVEAAGIEPASEDNPHKMPTCLAAVSVSPSSPPNGRSGGPQALFGSRSAGQDLRWNQPAYMASLPAPQARAGGTSLT